MMTAAVFDSIAREAAGRVNCSASEADAEGCRQTEVLAGIGSVLVNIFATLEALLLLLEGEVKSEVPR